MQIRLLMLNDENVDLAAFFANGLASYSVARLVDDRPSFIYLWARDGDGIALCSEPVDVAARLEVGVIKVAKADKRTAHGEASETRLPDEFLSPTTAFILQIEANGVVVDNGLYLLTKAGGEFQITSANWPNALSFKIDRRSKDYEPEYLVPDYRFTELAGGGN